MTAKQRFTSVWDALENTLQEAASMKARSAVMMALVIRARSMTQEESAAIFGVLLPACPTWCGVNRFSLYTLIDMAATAGITPVIKFSKLKLGLSCAGLQGTLEPF
jgi:predicted XRE-type DNA-binding protein